MSVLHTHFHRRDQQAFQRTLDTSIRALSQQQDKPGTSKSPRRQSPLSALSTASLDVNAHDALGRTVLHLACSSTHTSAPTYVRLLLSHPHIHVNAQDAESHWTPLHRALYAGNIANALLLLARHDIDMSIKDSEGYTAFDVYNSSVSDTKPQEGLDAELFVWGSNRNAGLGLGDSDDRAFPELVQLGHPPRLPSDLVEERFRAIRVKDVGLARFHTAVVTSESQNNVRVCGFGSNARLGSGLYTTIYTLTSLAGLPASSTSIYFPPPISRTPTSSPSSKKQAVISSALRAVHTKPRLETRSDAHRIVSVAVGQDHTLALTAAGEVYSWGSNKNAVLGYVIEPPQSDDPFASEQLKSALAEDGSTQATPRKVQGQLKGRKAIGVTACQTASACWTEDGVVLSWGTNSGQLGYGTSPSTVQVLPRVVSKVNQSAIQVDITDVAMLCLLESHDVLCLYGDSHFRITFPPHAFPSAIAPYRPPQANRNASINKIVGIDIAASASASGSASSMFAAVSDNGELFTWTLSAIDGFSERDKERSRREVVRPQRVWALRKKFSAIKDVALGPEGSILVCTESGHVFLRSRLPPSANAPSAAQASSATGTGGPTAKAFKFQRVPLLQRVVAVHASSAGAYAALRIDARVDIVPVEGRVLREELRDVIAWWGERVVKRGSEAAERFETQLPPEPVLEDAVNDRLRDAEDDTHDPAVLEDQALLSRFLGLFERHAASRKDGSPDLVPFSDAAPRPHGADLTVHILAGSEARVPAHRAVLGARSKALRDVLAGQRTVDIKNGTGSIRFALAKKTPHLGIRTDARNPAPWAHPSRLAVSGVHPLTVLILLQYLYTDDLLAVWDWRIVSPAGLKAGLDKTKAKPAQIKMELQAIAAALELREMEQALEGAFKREVKESAKRDFIQVFEDVCAGQGLMKGEEVARDPLKPDVILLLEDREVPCHSIILRARSPLFKAFFDEAAWTTNRWTAEGMIRMDFTHLGWRAMQYVVRYLYGGDREMFDVLEFVTSVDELIEFMFSIMSAANELLLDRLVLVCSSVIRQYVNLSNACSVLTDATFFNATALVRAVQGYMARNLETLLEAHTLDDLAPDLVKQFASYIREEQARKAPLARSTILVDFAMEKHRAWLEDEDFPVPIIRTNAPRPPPIRKRSNLSLAPSRTMQPKADVADDGVFLMDEINAVPPLDLGLAQPPPKIPTLAEPTPTPGVVTQKTSVGWKVSTVVPKVDMKAIMAEAQTTTKAPPVVSGSRTPTAPPSTPHITASDVSNWRTPQRKPVELPDGSPRPPPGSPWKPVEPPQAKGVLTLPITPQKVKEKPREEPKPGMGPVITPVRLPSSKGGPSSGPRRVASGSAAWTLPPPQPTVQPTPSPSTSGMSFVAIQQLQLQQASGTPKKDRRSLKEIQEEEAAKQAEEDFLRWWAAEEERVRVEEVQAAREAERKERRKGKKAVGKEKAGIAHGGAGESGEAAKGGESSKGGKRATGKSEKGEKRREERKEKPVDVAKEGESAKQPNPRRRRKPPHAQSGETKPPAGPAGAS